MTIATEAVIDGAALTKELTAIAGGRKGTLAPADRTAIVNRLKALLAEGRAEAERQLREDGRGTLCARRLSDLQDTIIQGLHDFAIHNVYLSDNPTSSERMAIVAVGGYGRGTLAPGSDIDLLFLLPYKQTPWGEQVVEFILYMLWDLGLKVGHATRNVDECIRLSRSDMTIRTAILEARYIWGDKALFDELVGALRRRGGARAPGRNSSPPSSPSATTRHRQQGTSRYLVEPNVKDGKGGLRDLHTLFWIAKYFYRVRSREELVKAGVFSRAELARFRKCRGFPLGGALPPAFPHRPAPRSGCPSTSSARWRCASATRRIPACKDVERFMKHYFLVAKDVGDLTRIFCAALEEQHGKPVPALNRFLGLGRKRRRKIPGTTDFVVDNDRINIADDEVFARDPVNLIRIFHLADAHDLPLPSRRDAARHPLARADRRQAARRRGGQPAVPRDPDVAQATPSWCSARMNETGVLGRFIPDFGKIVAMMQFTCTTTTRSTST